MNLMTEQHLAFVGVVLLVLGWISIVDWFVMIKRNFHLTERQTLMFIAVGQMSFTLFVLVCIEILLEINI